MRIFFLNDSVLDSYSADTYANEDIEVSVDEVNLVIRSISLDTSVGEDGVLIKTVRDLNIGAIIKYIIDIMLAVGRTPVKLSEDRTVLIYKNGDVNNCSNYRPITIYYVIRRIIEKVLDKHLRNQISLNINQRGFTSIPGCHVNSKLINACLLDAKEKKQNCVVVFLDPIDIKCSVPQGGPLSPILFNLAIDFIYKELCEDQFANNY